MSRRHIEHRCGSRRGVTDAWRVRAGARTNSGPCATGEIEGAGDGVTDRHLGVASGAGEQERVRGAEAPTASRRA